MEPAIIQPDNRDDLRRLLSEAHARGQKIAGFDLSALARLLEHKAEDMTAKVEAGMALSELQAQLARRGQWLPVDPPDAERLSIGALLAANASGPRRFGCGTARDHLIGLTVALADGRLVRSGGNVVKNVAGYDLMKLFVGSRGSLGVLVEATFKLRPLPETEKFVQAHCPALAQAEKLAETILSSELTPVVLDLHNLSTPNPESSVLVLGLAGTAEDVAWQLSRAAELGIAEPSSLEYDRTFRTGNSSVCKLSVLPSRTIEVVRGLKGAPFVARLGNGIIYLTGSAGAFGGEAQVNAARTRNSPARAPALPVLLRRLKDEFDPKHILADLPT